MVYLRPSIVVIIIILMYNIEILLCKIPYNLKYEYYTV